MAIRLEGVAVFLLALAIVVKSGPLFFAGCCLLLLRAGAIWWLRVVGRGLSVRRNGDTRAFFGAQLTLEATVRNGSPLPMTWLRLRETLPHALILPNYRLDLTGLPPWGEHVFRYRLPARRRGLHAVGPLYLSFGDPFGLEERVMVAGTGTYVLVYPRLVPLATLGLPAAALMGTLPARRPLPGDPSRVVGVRGYRPGDPVHDIHWTATAAAGRLQVKQYEPATEMVTTLFLDLDAASYTGRAWRGPHAVELAITCAASLAWVLAEHRQSVGLVTTGVLTLPPPAAESGDLLPLRALAREPAPSEVGGGDLARVSGGVRLLPGKGRGHHIHLLEALARLEPQPAGPGRDAEPFTAVVTAEAARLSWGATAVVITGRVDSALWAALHRLREAGVRVLVALIDEGAGVAAARQAAEVVGVRLWPVWHEADLETGAS